MRPAKCQGVVAGVQLRYYAPMGAHPRQNLCVLSSTLCREFLIIDSSKKNWLGSDWSSLFFGTIITKWETIIRLSDYSKRFIDFSSRRFFFFLFIFSIYVYWRDIRVICNCKMSLRLRLFRCEPFNRETNARFQEKKSEGIGAREGRGGWSKLELWAVGFSHREYWFENVNACSFLSRILCRYIVSAK